MNISSEDDFILLDDEDEMENDNKESSLYQN